MLTEEQFKERMKEVGEQIKADGMEVDDVALDVAESLLYDPEIREYVEQTHSRTKWSIMKEIVADYIVD